jgi:hypothetical protein
MRKLMIAVATVAGLAFTAGCKRNEVQEERRDLAQAQQEAQKEMAEVRQETSQEQANLQREEQEELAEVQQDVAEEQKDVAEAQSESAERMHKEGAGTLAASSTIQGRVQSTSGDELVLIVPSNNNAELKLKTDDQTRVTANNLRVELDDFKEGTEVRASYVTDGDDMVARDIVILNPVKKQ